MLDPACGSGAFLLTALRYLVGEWHEVRELRRQRTGAARLTDDDAALIADILKSNIYGVDINSASVEIAQLALWLHTARLYDLTEAEMALIRNGATPKSPTPRSRAPGAQDRAAGGAQDTRYEIARGTVAP